MKRDFFVLITFLVISLVSIQAIILFTLSFDSSNQNHFKGDATSSGGFFSFCLKQPFEIDLSDCPSEFNQSTSIQDNSVSCKVSFIHPRNHAIVLEPYEEDYYSEEGRYHGVRFELKEDGQLFIDAHQPATWQEHTGILYDFWLFARDSNTSYPCEVSEVMTYSPIIKDINDPPFLVSPVPDFNITEGSSLVYSIRNNFDDVDVRPEFGKPFNYTFYVIGDKLNSIISISQDGVLTIRSPVGNCETDNLIFEVKDRGNLTAESNVVKITSKCEESPPQLPARPSGGDIDICVSKWRCDEWSDCLVNGTQSRLCTDLHRCDLLKFRHLLWRECEYIEPVIDEAIEEEAGDPDATCFDGIQNCHIMPDGSILCEEGIDCGGPCEPCLRIETPGFTVDESANKLVLIFASIIIFIAVITTTYILFRKQISSLLARLGWWLTRSRRKQFLLNVKQKETLLKEINSIYSKVHASSVETYARKDKDLVRLLSIARNFFVYALKISEEFVYEDLKKGLFKVVINNSFRHGLLIYGDSLFQKERKSTQLSKQELLNLLQETRFLVLSTSKLSKHDFDFKALEVESNAVGLEKALALIHNSYLALCFSETVSAKKNYFELMALYSKLADKEKSKIYYELVKIYNYTKTILSWIK